MLIFWEDSPAAALCPDYRRVWHNSPCNAQLLGALRAHEREQAAEQQLVTSGVHLPELSAGT